MKHVLMTICLVLTVPVFALGGGRAAFAASELNQTVPVSGTDVNPCTGDVFAYSGFFHMVIHRTVTSDGSLHFGVDENGSVQGVDATGTKYVENGIESFTNFHPAGQPLPQVFEFPTTDVVLSQGSTPNFYFHALNHITVNANGDVTVSIDSISMTCN